MTRDDELLELAARVADGQGVSWDAAATVDAHAELRGLRVLCDLVAAFGPPAADEGTPVPRAWGSLQIRARLGSGSFGEVFRAWDPQLQREVALKLLRSEQHGAGARLLGEARRLARVRNPNVIVVHGAGEHKGRHGMWMELVPGRTLAQRLAADGPLPARQAAAIGAELCRALDAVHATGLVHGDVKAGNVMCEPGGRVVLMDFGAGALAPGLTPLYAAPELLAGGVPDAHSDVYALGVLLFHLVTGGYPFEAASLGALREAHARGARRALADVRPELPADFVAAVERALAPRGQRPHTARALGALLERCLRPRARAGRIALLGSLLVALSGLALLGVRRFPQNPPRAPEHVSSQAAPPTAPSSDPAPSSSPAPAPSSSPAPAPSSGPAPAASPAPLPAPTAMPAAASVAPEAPAEATSDPLLGSLESSLAELAPLAARAQALRANHERICGGVRRIEQRNALDDTVVTTFVPNEELPSCRAESVELLQLEARIRRGVSQVEEDARRARVLPGTLRALRERHGLDSNRWDYP